MSTLTAILAPSALDQNLACHRCGYNLRTLAPSARCPECSTPIASSLDVTLLRYADPSWTQALALALGLMIFSVVFQTLQLLTLLLFLKSQDLWMFATLLMKGYQFVVPLFWLGVYLLGQRNLLTDPPSRRFSLRRAMRIAALLNLTWAILPELKIPTLPVDQLLDLVGTTFLYFYLLQIARRSGKPRLILHTCIAMIILIVADFVTISIHVFFDNSDLENKLLFAFLPVFAYQFFVLSLFRRTLRKCAAFARQYWHFCSPIHSATPDV
jgi:hypothetical protein